MTPLQLLHPGQASTGQANVNSQYAEDGSHSDQSRLPHVLLILDQFPKASGGAERIAFRQAMCLPQYGYRVSILTFFAHPDSSCLIDPPCPIYLLPLTSTHNRQALIAAKFLRDLVLREDVRIVQTFFESSDLWAGTIIKATSDAKLVWSRRDMGILRHRKHGIAYRLLAGIPDAVLAVSNQVKQHAIEVDGIAADRVRTIYNGLDLADWSSVSSRPVPRRGPVVTTVGNLRHVKGHDVLLEAAAIIRNSRPDITFTIGGAVLEPEYNQHLLDRVKELKLQDHVTFVGSVRNLKQHLAGADLFVLPSRSEGFSNAIIEAMAASLPVVATDVGGNAEAVRDGQTGHIVPPEDPSALAHAILDILSDQARATAMGKAGRAAVAENFTTDAMMLQITRLYDELLMQA